MSQIGRLTSLLQSTLTKGIDLESLKLKDGQLLFATIKKLYPNQTALLQMNSTSFVAKLETALTLGPGLFQVALTEEGIVLKPKESTQSRSGARNESVNSEIDSLLMTKDRDTRMSLLNLVKENLPFTKKQLVEVSQWFSDLSTKEDGVSAVRIIVERNLPMTKTVFKSIVTAVQNESFSNLFRALAQQLALNESYQGSGELQKVLQELLSNKREIDPLETFQRLLNSLTEETVPIQEKRWGVSQLQQASILPSSANEKNWLQQLVIAGVQHIENATESDLIHLLPIQKVPKSEGNREIERTVMKLIEEKQPKEIQNLLSINKEKLSLLYEQLQGAKTVSNDNIPLSARQLTQQIQHQFSRLGFNYEHFLQTINRENLQEINHLLKPLLVALLTEDVSSESKNIASEILHKLNGQNLLSQPLQGMQHIIFSIPLDFIGLSHDLTLQWTGKQKKDGSIDADFCRVVFHLQLETLNEMIIDMNVQNRIVSLRVFNEHTHLKELAAPFVKILKESMREKGYTLTSIAFEQEANQSTIERNYQSSKFTSKGVDIKI
ncbi:hypothetical protein [Bacillus sp. 2205SS5-2]|uniref:hypothetical protein n=1 Tax=Bacillus sp. 2205SS5-2 TaxID=3109031 RepID=UPI003004F7B3